MVSPKSQGATLPTNNGTLSPDHQPNGQSDALPPPSGGAELAGHAQLASTGPGVAYAIIAASPAPGKAEATVSEAVKVRTRPLNTATVVNGRSVLECVCVCVQVIIIQPQAPDSTDGSPSIQTNVSPQETLVPTPVSLKKDEDPEVRDLITVHLSCSLPDAHFLSVPCRKLPSWWPWASSPQNTWKVHQILPCLFVIEENKLKTFPVTDRKNTDGIQIQSSFHDCCFHF